MIKIDLMKTLCISNYFKFENNVQEWVPEHAYEEYEPDTPGAKIKSKAYKKSNRYSNFG